MWHQLGGLDFRLENTLEDGLLTWLVSLCWLSAKSSVRNLGYSLQVGFSLGYLGFFMAKYLGLEKASHENEVEVLLLFITCLDSHIALLSQVTNRLAQIQCRKYRPQCLEMSVKVILKVT